MAYRIFLVLVLSLIFNRAALAQGNPEVCLDILNQIKNELDGQGVPRACDRVEELRSACRTEGVDMSSLAIPMKDLCDMRRSDIRKAEETKKKQLELSQKPDAKPPETQSRPSPNPLPRQNTTSHQAIAQSNRADILAHVSLRLQQSLTRTRILQADLQALINMAQKIGDAYFERRAGSALAYTPEQDDALADSRGYLKRESDNFIVFYRTGDMTRAQTVLRNAEASIPTVEAFLQHFPSVSEHHGRKLPIYLANTHQNYLELSKCSNNSNACVSHFFFDDGAVQTMYVSPKSYQRGAKTEDRVENFRRTIQHELTHYAQFDMVTGATARSMPRWFVEGLASYVGGQDDRMVDLAAEHSKGKPLLSFSELQAAGLNIYDSPNVLLFYEEGYSIFDMLVSVKGIEQTKALIVDVTQNEDFESALGTAMGLTPEEFDQQWRQFEQKKYGLNIPPSTGLSSSLVSTSSATRDSPATSAQSSAAQAAATVSSSSNIAITTGPETAVQILNQGPINYPPLAHDKRIEGTLLVRVYVNESGDAQQIQIVERNVNPKLILDDASNWRDVTTIFDQPTIDSLRVSRWKPATKNGRSVGVWVEIPMNYQLAK